MWRVEVDSWSKGLLTVRLLSSTRANIRVLQAVIANAETREEDLPETIEEANKTLSLYIDRVGHCQKLRLQVASLKLSMAVLSTAQQIIGWFKKSATRMIPDTTLKSLQWLISIYLR